MFELELPNKTFLQKFVDKILKEGKIKIPKRFQKRFEPFKKVQTSIRILI
jgi:hypothetical protein